MLEALADYLKDEGFDVSVRLIHPRAIGSHHFIVVYGTDKNSSFGITIIGAEVELCSIKPTSDCPEGFPDDHLSFFELSDHNFPDNLINVLNDKLHSFHTMSSKGGK